MFDEMVWLWLAVMVLAVFIEMSTLTLVSIWCAIGALAAVFAAYFGAPFAAQLLLFIGVSIVVAAVVRPIAKRYAAQHAIPTNADRLLGMNARVTEAIDNSRPSGTVYVDGKTWTARSVDGGVIPMGEMVEIERMEGVKLIVRMKAAVTAG